VDAVDVPLAPAARRAHRQRGPKVARQRACRSSGCKQARRCGSTGSRRQRRQRVPGGRAWREHAPQSHAAPCPVGVAAGLPLRRRAAFAGLAAVLGDLGRLVPDRGKVVGVVELREVLPASAAMSLCGWRPAQLAQSGARCQSAEAGLAELNSL